MKHPVFDTSIQSWPRPFFCANRKFGTAKPVFPYQMPREDGFVRERWVLPYGISFADAFVRETAMCRTPESLILYRTPFQPRAVQKTGSFLYARCCPMSWGLCAGGRWHLPGFYVSRRDLSRGLPQQCRAPISLSCERDGR